MKTEDKIKLVCESGLDRKADDIVIMEMIKKSSLCEFFIVMSGSSTVRVKSIVDNIEESLETAGFRAFHKEGYQDGSWILLDYGDIVAHIFYHETRKFYDLEKLWGDAPKRHFLK